MGRPKSPHPKVRFHVTLTQETYARVHLLVRDPTSERGFKDGALSAFFEQAALDRLEKLRAAKDAAPDLVRSLRDHA
jgi:hypothetical protein